MTIKTLLSVMIRPFSRHFDITSTLPRFFVLPQYIRCVLKFVDAKVLQTFFHRLSLRHILGSSELFLSLSLPLSVSPASFEEKGKRRSQPIYRDRPRKRRTRKSTRPRRTMSGCPAKRKIVVDDSWRAVARPRIAPGFLVHSASLTRNASWCLGSVHDRAASKIHKRTTSFCRLGRQTNSFENPT